MASNRPHQALKMNTPSQALEMFKLAAYPVQKLLDHYIYQLAQQTFIQIICRHANDRQSNVQPCIDYFGTATTS
jgi:hypothetical protein